MLMDRLDPNELFLITDSDPRAVEPPGDRHDTSQVLRTFHSQNRPVMIDGNNYTPEHSCRYTVDVTRGSEKKVCRKLLRRLRYDEYGLAGSGQGRSQKPSLYCGAMA